MQRQMARWLAPKGVQPPCGAAGGEGECVFFGWRGKFECVFFKFECAFFGWRGKFEFKALRRGGHGGHALGGGS